MKEENLLLSFDYKPGFFSSLFGWMICLSQKHNWQFRSHWKLIHKASVGCPRCRAVQFLEDVSDDWDGQYTSRRVDPISAVLSLAILISVIFIISIILINVI